MPEDGERSTDGAGGPFEKISPRVQKMWREAVRSRGKCMVCGAEGELFSGVCSVCFTNWAADTLNAQIRREKGMFG